MYVKMIDSSDGEEADVDVELPEGFEERVTSDGKVYYAKYAADLRKILHYIDNKQ